VRIIEPARTTHLQCHSNNSAIKFLTVNARIPISDSPHQKIAITPVNKREREREREREKTYTLGLGLTFLY
jgi:hypothetical protein